MSKNVNSVDKTVARVATVRSKGEPTGKGPRAGLRKKSKCALVYKTAGLSPAKWEK